MGMREMFTWMKYHRSKSVHQGGNDALGSRFILGKLGPDPDTHGATAVSGSSSDSVTCYAALGSCSRAAPTHHQCD